MPQSPLVRRITTTVAAAPERFGLALIRIVVGLVFIMHGGQKWFVYKPSTVVASFAQMGFPAVAAYATMAAEFGCGILLIIGLFTRLAAIPIVVVMGVAVLQVHLKNGFFLMPSHGYEYALTLGVAALALVLAGPGTLAADNLLSEKR